MMPKSYLVFKWTVYSLATLGLFALQYLVLSHIQVLGLSPFLYPILPAVAASYEGLRRGSVFALVVGVVCDLLLPGPFRGLLHPGLYCGSADCRPHCGESPLPRLSLRPGGIRLSLAVTGALRLFAQFLSGGGYLGLMSRMILVEALITLPAVIVVVPVYRLIHDRCASDY